MRWIAKDGFIQSDPFFFLLPHSYLNSSSKTRTQSEWLILAMLGQIRNILLSLPFALKKWNKNFSASTRYIRLSVFSELFCWFQRQNFAPDWKTLPRHKKVGVKSTREEREEVCMYMCITVGPQLPCWLLPKIIEKIVTYCQFQVHHHENFQEKSWVNKFFLKN